MFGCAGELWNRSWLMDWSYAGYMYGDFRLPRMAPMANIKTVFGAVGNGVADDTAAFEAAISSMPPQSTLLVPRGTYVITRVRNSNSRATQPHAWTY
jgi:hypothetical protein